MDRLKIGQRSITSLPITVKAIDKENYTLTMVASSQDVDRHGDTIIQSGWNLKPYAKNPVILNSHNYYDATEVIAKAKKTWIEGEGKKSKLLQIWEFAVDANPKAKIIFDLYAGGFLHASSVGFIPRKFQENPDGSKNWYVIEEAELLEVSAVSVPANATATLAKSIGVDESELRKVVKVIEDEEIADDAETVEDEIEDDLNNPNDIDVTETDETEEEAETIEEDVEDTLDEEIEPEEDADELDIDEVEEKTVAPKLSKTAIVAKVINSLNERQERELKAVHATIEKMLKGESTEVKRDYNSVIRRLLKAK